MAFGLTQQAQLVHEDQDNADGRNETENKDIQRIISGTECPVVGHFTPDNAAVEYPSHKDRGKYSCNGQHDLRRKEIQCIKEIHSSDRIAAPFTQCQGRSYADKQTAACDDTCRTAAGKMKLLMQESRGNFMQGDRGSQGSQCQQNIESNRTDPANTGTPPNACWNTLGSVMNTREGPASG